MPSNIVQTLANKSGETEERVEELWGKAKSIVIKEYPQIEKESDKFYALVTGIVKRMLKLDEEAPSITTSSAGNIASVGGAGNHAKYQSFVKRNDVKKKKKKKGKNESFLDLLNDYL